MIYHYTLGLIFIISLGTITTKEVPTPPFIIKQPPTDEVLFQVEESGETDRPFYIECEAVGEPAPKYRWIKNGKEFNWHVYDDRISQQPGRGTLSIVKPQNVDIGQYQCFAENEYGVATSNSVFMRKSELNSFKVSQPITLVGEEGKPFKLTCQPPDGWPKPVVHWIYLYTDNGIKTINDSRMTLDPEGNLWFSNLTKKDVTDNFMYACAASSLSQYEYKYGNRVLLNVISSGVSAAQNKHEPVLQYVTRKNEVAYRGKRAELFCIFGGTPLPQTVWSKNGQIIHLSDRITQGNYGKSLIIKAVDFEDEGYYTCEVSNGVGEAKSYSISLKVYAVPYFTVEPERVNAAQDETAEFRCEASGVPEPEIHWIHNGKPIEQAPPNPRRKVYKNKIIIERLTKNDTGNYGCNATNSLGYVYKDVYVNVLALPPEITEAPKDKEAVDGQNVNLTCRVLGAPKPNIKWVHNGQTLTGGRYYVRDSGLLINKVQFEDTGEYTCYAENKFGNTSASARLSVKSHTYITDGPEDYEVEAGTPATFRCNAVADESLNLEILWLKSDQPIDFEGEPRFVKSSDYSLTISKTIELDSGVYTCLAKTDLDEASASAHLTVQDVPNPPSLESIECHSKDATITWKPMGDNRAPILHFIIQYNTTFEPDVWENAYGSVPASEKSYNVPMSPWANYTFRVIAVNKIGQSLPSSHSEVCSTDVEVPHKNPDNVKGEGDRPDNLIISWTPMPEIEHNAPKFQYRVFWKKSGTRDYNSVDITDWRQDRFIVENVPTFKPYDIKVIAMNEKGVADVSPNLVVGWSGESEPLTAPSNFTLLQIQSGTTAILGWNPVNLDDVRGHFKGYKIKTWSDNSLAYNEIQVQGQATQALVSDFTPYTQNHAQIYVYNSKYNGPPSEMLNFETPEGVPGQMSYLKATPLGSNAFWLTWKKPSRPNGIILGYNIYYGEVIDDSMKVTTPVQSSKRIDNPNQTHAKISGLKPATNYRISITAYTAAGESERYFIESETKHKGRHKPAQPSFSWEQLKSNPNQVRIYWHPNEDSHPGVHFSVKYRRAGASSFEEPIREYNEDFVTLTLERGVEYEAIVTSEDDVYSTDSKPAMISTYLDGGVTVTPKDNVATAGWFIGMMLAIAFLLILLIIVCIVKRNRGGKYAVHEREQHHGRTDFPDEGGFHEYSQPLDNKSHGRASMSSEPKAGAESDTDSMIEYGEGDTAGMNEDGSFIGQYGRKRGQGETTSQGFATLV